MRRRWLAPPPRRWARSRRGGREHWRRRRQRPAEVAVRRGVGWWATALCGDCTACLDRNPYGPPRGCFHLPAPPPPSPSFRSSVAPLAGAPQRTRRQHQRRRVQRRERRLAAAGGGSAAERPARGPRWRCGDCGGGSSDCENGDNGGYRGSRNENKVGARGRREVEGGGWTEGSAGAPAWDRVTWAEEHGADWRRDGGLREAVWRRRGEATHPGPSVVPHGGCR